MNPLETYLRELRDIRSSGAAVKETSYYGALEALFNEIGRTLTPRVRCIITIQNRGAGLPDGGLFTAEQLQRASAREPLPGQIPARGVIEVKGTADDAWVIADGTQVTRYWGRYRQVLVTNYRDFVLVGQDPEGRPVKMETYRLAPSKQAFWAAAAHPRSMAEVHGQRFIEYLKRVLLHAAPLTGPEDVAWFLASYAREARTRMEGIDLPALKAVRDALEEALGVKFEGTKGEHFFRSTLVQTLFYGIFSAWVLWSKKRSGRDPKLPFDHRLATGELRVPILRKLFHEIAEPGQMEELNLAEVLDWAGATLNRVDRAAFFAKFEDTHAIQYFYEPFLQAYDPELRKELGVWYTPPEIVRYMVARVDTVLREELKLEDGLADPNVYVLDPGCGTGTYLVEVLRRIHATLKAKRDDALLGEDLRKAACKRVFGFEILPAPFVVAHLQIGLLLQTLGAGTNGKHKERIGVFLTNALTGWEPPKEEKKQLTFRELEEERDAAERVKQATPILVVLGNPPYNAFAGVSPDEEMGLVEPYKEGLNSEWGIKKFNLDDLYVRFFRLAERRIAEKTGRGVVCYISNFSYLGDPSFVVMRRRFLAEFDRLWFDCMNGDSRETGKLTPEGQPDPSVFSTEANREGIRVGTAIGLMVRRSERVPEPVTRFRHFWGASKRADLLASLAAHDLNPQYTVVEPEKSNRFSFRPSQVAAHYLAWPQIVELASQQPFAGLSEDRRKALISMDKPEIEARMRMYFDPRVDWKVVEDLDTGLTNDVPRFDAKKARSILLEREEYLESRLVRFAMRPFDIMWCYYSPVRPLWREPRPEYWERYEIGTPALVTRFKAAKFPEGPPVAFARQLCDYHMLPPNASIIPVMLLERIVGKRTADQKPLLATEDSPSRRSRPNLSDGVFAYLAAVGAPDPSRDARAARLVWDHCLAVAYSPAYLADNADGIRQDWPRIPLPGSKAGLLRSAELGRRVAALLDTEENVAAVTSGRVRPELKAIATICRTDGKQINPAAGDLDVRAGWGHAGKGGVTMPARGRLVERPYSTEEQTAFRDGARALGMAQDEALGQMGSTTCDVYLNDQVFWRNVPAHVWTYTIGGYQVIKKWLSYREFGLLGRALTRDEALEVMNMARRIAAILLLQPALDANYLEVEKSPYEWPQQT